MKTYRYLSLILSLLAAMNLSAQTSQVEDGLQMPAVYSDHMMLQYGQPLVIRGTAVPGQKVTVSVAGQCVRTKTGRDGRWKACLRPLQAGGPYTLVVRTAQKTLTYQDVLAGDVWLCCGQSNMEFQLSQATTAAQDVPQATNSQIRLYDQKGRWPTNNPGAWSLSNRHCEFLRFSENTHRILCISML